MSEEKMKLPKISVDDFFSTQEERENKSKDYIEYIPVKDIDDFPEHPFSVEDDELMDNIVRSIEEEKFVPPAIIRPKENGRYEMVAGHRRKRAFTRANKEVMPCIIKKLDNEEATILMVDTNINQRQNILPSEKAKAYKMRFEAMKRKAGRPKKEATENSAPMEQNLKGKTTRELLAEEMGESSSNIQRYMRLNELIPEMLRLVDKGKMKLRPAVELSYLTQEEQQQVLDAIEYTEAFPSHPQAIKMKELSEEEKLTVEQIYDILGQEKPNQIPKFKIQEDKVDKYIPTKYQSTEEKQNYIVYCVKKVSELEKKAKQHNEYLR